MIHLLYVNEDGSSTGVYTDSLLEVFEQCEASIERASNVEWDHGEQKWVARLNDGRVIATSKNRKEAIDLEVEFLNNMMSMGLPIPRQRNLQLEAI
jgi:hypothetical protein